MNLQYRIDLLSRLGEYILNNDHEWKAAKEKAGYENGWFIPPFIDLASDHIAREFLDREKLQTWLSSFKVPALKQDPLTVGIVMAGNIPMVGFHDLLCVFLSGHKAFVKSSSKDAVLIPHLVKKLQEWDKQLNSHISFGEMLKGCDAYIATGSNNTAGYFEHYFGKYPHIIRRNRTSLAILDGNETQEELNALADDVFLYFGHGCRNVTKLFTPPEYDFVPLLKAFKKYDHLGEHFKYKNNYDYNLAIHLLNRKMYMSTPAILLIEDPALFSPLSQLNYETYQTRKELLEILETNTQIQCIVGNDFVPFGQSQFPAVSEYADGVDTLTFLKGL